jgi:hypothetical protein
VGSWIRARPGFLSHCPQSKGFAERRLANLARVVRLLSYRDRQQLRLLFMACARSRLLLVAPWKTWFTFTPCSRAIGAIEAPGTSVASTICRFAASSKPIDAAMLPPRSLRDHSRLYRLDHP